MGVRDRLIGGMPLASNSTFMTSPKLLFSSESVTEGHPDKVCDQVSDAVLDAILRDDPEARVAGETAATTGLVFVFGEITTSTYVEIPIIVRNTLRRIGYTEHYGFDADTCGVITSIKPQSPDIAAGVDTAEEIRLGESAGDRYDKVGAGDQGMMVGFACNETPELMPLPISLAHRLCRRLSQVRRDGTLPWLRPDGKAQVTVEYHYGRPARVDAVVVSAHHTRDVNERIYRPALIEEVVRAVIPAGMIDEHTKFHINPSGRFVQGGPEADAGLTGRKIIVDTYGGMARHGGGAFSGKDPTKVDRSAAYAARHVAKNVVAAGLADRFEVQIAYAIGKAHPVSIMCESFGTGRVDDSRIEALIRDHFDLRPLAIIEKLNLRRPIYEPTAAYGHFGRDDIDAPWERTDKADLLRREAGLGELAAPTA